MKNRKSGWKIFIGGLIALGIALALFYWLLRPSMTDFTVMFQLMGLTGAISLGLTFIAYQKGWLEHIPSLRLALIAAYVLAGSLIFLNVLVTARLMFASEHDLMLSAVLLVFATAVAGLSGFFLAESLISRISEVDGAARRLAGGDLSVRVSETGSDEMAGLSRAFNQMALELQSTRQKQDELDGLRRDLIAWVSHDLRTPLTSIRAILEALSDGVVEKPEDIKRYISNAQGEIRSLSNLIDDLFVMAQMDAGGLTLDIQQNSLGDLISDTLESFSEIARRNEVSLTGSIEPGIDPVRFDHHRLSRAVGNLVGNALRHTPSGGEISLCASRDGDHVEIVITDSGEGISPDDIGHIFDRFYRSEKSRSRQTGGAGLGLAISKGIIEAHSGKIVVQSQPGSGSKFIISLPE
jgi:signal transduction histidine kinase